VVLICVVTIISPDFECKCLVRNDVAVAARPHRHQQPFESTASANAAFLLAGSGGLVSPLDRDRGDARKTPNPADGRSYYLVLTRKGQKLADQGWPAVVAAFERMTPYLERPAAEHLPATRELRLAVKHALAGTRAVRGVRS
jgi:hypothetical protein